MTRWRLLPCCFLLLLGWAGRAAAVPALTATVPLGPRPVAVAVDPSTHRVYVADVELGQVVQLDGAQRTATGTINVGDQPSSLAVDDRGRRLFVGNRGIVGPAVTVVDTAGGRTRALIPAGLRVHGLAFDPQVNLLYVGDADGGNLLVVNADSGSVTNRVPLGGLPVAVAVNKSNGEVAAAVQGAGPSLVLLDPNTRNLTRVPVMDGQPLHVDVDTGTGKFFVTRGGTNPALLVLRPGSNTFDNAIPIAPGPTGLAVDSRSSRIYLAHAGPNLATVIDGASGQPVALVPIGDMPNHVAVDMGSTPARIYIVDTASSILSILTDQ